MSAPQLLPFVRWAEEDGDVLWWRFPIEQAPYVGTPLDLGHTVKVTLQGWDSYEIGSMTESVGGWPFLDADDGSLFWQRIDVPEDPRP